MKAEKVKNTICEWIKSKLHESGCKGFVVGVSGGIDSAVTSTLCAHTNMPLVVVNMPISQEKGQADRSNEHIKWLCANFSNVSGTLVDLTDTYSAHSKALSEIQISELAIANLKSRIRMCCLYSVANTNNYLVVGTGNKVEDYGIGFFTKYGDGGVDISPIADLLKSEVRALGQHLNVSQAIIDAKPTDGLWGDNRSDEDQIGASYEELEWALEFFDSKSPEEDLSARQTEVLTIYKSRHLATKHKLETPPVCYLDKN